MDPIRVVVEVDGDSAKFHTTFPLDEYAPMRKKSGKGPELVAELRKVNGLKNDDLDIWVHPNEVSVQKLHAFKWKGEVAPAVVEVLKAFYKFEKIEVKYE